MMSDSLRHVLTPGSERLLKLPHSVQVPALLWKRHELSHNSYRIMMGMSPFIYSSGTISFISEFSFSFRYNHLLTGFILGRMIFWRARFFTRLENILKLIIFLTLLKLSRGIGLGHLSYVMISNWKERRGKMRVVVKWRKGQFYDCGNQCLNPSYSLILFSLFLSPICSPHLVLQD